MTLYYEDDRITIYHGDCREILPRLKADVILTDPPYGNGTPYDGYEDTRENLVTLIGSTLPLMRNAAKRVAITPGVGNIHRWPAPTWTLCWFEAMGSGSGPWGFCTWQPILVYGADPYLAEGLGRRPDGFTAGRGTFRPLEDYLPTDEWHPVGKPLAVGRWLANRLTTQPATFIDPFMGGGGFVRALRDLGHQVIGIEQSERYCEIAVQRLAQGVLELSE